METKYSFEFEKKDIKTETIRLTNQLWKLIPMRVKGENWDRQ